MLKSVSLSLKWGKLGLSFKNNYKWITSTNDGCINLKGQLLELGVLGIKFGQFLYSNKEIISHDQLHIFESFLSDNSVHSKEETYKMIQLSDDSNFTKNNTITIDNNILGSGSLAQTHICYLNNDTTRKYVLKVAHPNILDLKNEIVVLKYLIKTVSYFSQINIDWESFFKNIETQIDFNNESDNMKIFYEIYKNYEKIEVPQLIHGDRYYIVMTFCEGVQLNLVDVKSEKYFSAVRLIASSFLHTSYKYFITHGDLHKGNILVKPNGHIALLDFGLCNNLMNEKTKTNETNELLYIYHNFFYTLDYKNTDKLFNSLFIFNEKYDKSILIKNFIKKISLAEKPKDKKNIQEVTAFKINLVKGLIKFSYKNNLKIKENLINLITQLFIMESLIQTPYYNGTVLFRTLSHMKKDDFFKNEMSEYILKFHELEYNNEIDEVVKKRYA